MISKNTLDIYSPSGIAANRFFLFLAWDGNFIGSLCGIKSISSLPGVVALAQCCPVYYHRTLFEWFVFSDF